MKFFVSLNWRCFIVFINKPGFTTLYSFLVQVSQRLPQALFLTQFYFEDLELPLFQHVLVVLTRSADIKIKQLEQYIAFTHSINLHDAGRWS